MSKREKKPKIVVLTGAGMSAESGLGVFRGSGGLWDNYRVEDVASAEALQRNPELVIQFANDRRKEYASKEPNEGHRILAEMEKDYNMVIITQNIDDFHKRAGSSNVIHLHGEIMKCCSVTNPSKPLPLPEGRLEMTMDDKDEHGNMLRPFIVYFGEPVPNMTLAVQALQGVDEFLVVGTSLNVYPAAGLTTYVPHGVERYIIDPNDVPTSGFHHLRMGASEGIKEFRAIMDEKYGK